MTTRVLKPDAAWRHLKWYEYLPNRDRLALWARSKAPGRIHALRFDLNPDTTGWFDPVSRTIGINPTTVGKTVHEQWTGTRATTLHEVGHALYTGNLGTGLLHHLANILEDQRIEWLTCNSDPPMTRAMRFKNRWRWDKTTIATAEDDQPEHILEAALLHRWEWWGGIGRKKKTKSRASKAAPEKASKIVLCSENQTRWEMVRPWVEEAWVAESSDQVVAIARRILDFLKIPESTESPDLLMLLLKTDGLAKGSGTPLFGAPHPPMGSLSGRSSSSSSPDGAAPEEEDPLPSTPEDEPSGSQVGEDRTDLEGEINPNYAEWVDTVQPWVQQLAARLERPTPQVRTSTHATRGRYNLRAELRNPDKPFILKSIPAQAPGLVVDLLGDRSGSMGDAEPHVADGGSSKMLAARLGTLTIHLACEGRRIPHSLTLFDGFFSVLEYGGDAQLASALICGWNGSTGQEHVSNHMRRRAPKLLARPEGTKLLIVIHDGFPVALGDPEDIVRFQKEYAGRIYVVGVYLSGERGGHEMEVERMRGLFEHLIVAKPSELPDKLGDLIAALA